MSQITRCPHCQTRFKVVDDQLRISDGWVRCGKCKSVFDALAHLVSRSESNPPSVATSAASQVAAASPAPHPVVSPAKQAVASEPSVSVQTPKPSAAPPQAPQAAASASAASSPETAKSHALSPLDAGASAVLVTENSLAIDPHANAPELSVLVFPRRAGFGDSGYADSSWMSAYEGQAADAGAVLKSGASSANSSVALPRDAQAPGAEKSSALESEWSEAVGQLPDAVRNSSAGFSAHDDLAELQARESRLLDAIVEQKSKAEKRVVPLAGGSRSDAAPADVLTPAPPPEVEAAPVSKVEAGSASSQSEPVVHAQADMPHGNDADQPQVKEALFVAPEHSNRVVSTGKVEPALEAAHNYIAEIDGAKPQAEPAQEAVPGFVRAAQRKAFWSQPGVLAVSALCTLILLVVLVFQIGVSQRDQLAVQYPVLRPALEGICRLARCEIALPRHLQSVVIDSTSFNPIGPRQFKLTVVLRNTAAHAVAMPALELSLNDAAEKLLVRRVLDAGDLQAPKAIPPHGEWTGVVAIKVADNGLDVVGYRVLAFYP